MTPRVGDRSGDGFVHSSVERGSRFPEGKAALKTVVGIDLTVADADGRRVSIDGQIKTHALID